MTDKIMLYPKAHLGSLLDLRQLKSEVAMIEASGPRQRMGTHGINQGSIYTFSKRYTWTREQRARARSMLPELLQEHSTVEWFLEFPRGRGFLDRMTTWVGERMSATIYAVNIGTAAEIWIEDRPLKLQPGDAVAFNLRLIHEIRKSTMGQQWFCAQTLYPPELYGGEDITLSHLGG